MIQIDEDDSLQNFGTQEYHESIKSMVHYAYLFHSEIIDTIIDYDSICD